MGRSFVFGSVLDFYLFFSATRINHPRELSDPS